MKHTVTSDLENWLSEKAQVFLENIGVREGMRVLDYGCGVGHYTIPLAKMVGEGKVYAMDEDEEALRELMQTVESEGLTNVVPMKTSGDLRLHLGGECVDLVLLYDILHFMDLKGRRNLYGEVHSVLKNDGVLSVYPKHHKSDHPLWNLKDMDISAIIEEIEGAGFSLQTKARQQLMHNDNCDEGLVLNFGKKELSADF
jgi:cyclopropane fatty-acyl-phospholipid synthase-like methyltransferase